ncbi:MAG: replicative helicase [Gammaproteobacteria bacterium]|jgi:replicative DNA helicase|nr:replicative helicase [Gammaproteobacteria bacterium]
MMMGKAAPKWSSEEMEQLKVPPHSIEAEQSVIGGLMLDNLMWDRVAEQVNHTDFYRREHRVIFSCIAKLAENSTPFDVITLCDALEAQGELENVGGLSYLGELAKNTPSVANIGAYAEIVRERSIFRKLLAVSSEVAEAVYHPGGRASSEILDEAERKVFAIAEHGASKDSGPVPVKNIMPGVVEKLDELMSTKGGITGISSDFKDLDSLTSGLQPADMIIVAGRPSMGKTTFAMNIAENVAMNSPKPVLVFSMEMPKEALMMRILSSLSRVDQSALRSGQLKDHDWTKIFATVSMISEQMNLFIDDTPALSPTELRSRARRLAREHDGLRMIVIDYLQLMQVPGGAENRVNEVSEISRAIKAVAKELNIPIIALSQLSRKCEERNDKRPMMSDIRESGAIEQDADVIMFVYRDEVYNPETADKGTAEILIRKQRNGPIGDVRLTFQGHYCRFDNFAPVQIGG